MDPYTWIYLIIAIIVSVALAPKPPKPRPASLEDFDMPTAEEGRPIPVVFGTVRITGPNILWYGDLGTKAMKKSSLFGSTTIGYKYYMGLHFGLCHGPVDAVTKIECGDKLAWSGNVTTNTSITVHKPDLFGGKKREGGISGTFDVCMGGSAQTANNYLDRAIGYNFITGEVVGDLPAFRGILGLVWHGGGSGGLFSMLRLDEGGYIGTTPYPKPWAFTVKRITSGWHGGTVWYSAKAAIGSAMNGAHIVYQTLTDPEWGMGLPADKLDEASFTAAADLLHSENFGLSLLWNQQATVEDFLTEILNHIAGVLAFDRSTGKYRLTLLRGNYDANALPAYGPETLSSIDSFQRQAWGETVNELTLSYTDPTSLKSTSVTAHDLANVRAQGVRVATTISYPGIVSATIAQQVAMRELAARSTPLAKVSFRVNRDLWPTKNADVVKLTWPALGIENLIVRVLRVRQGSLGFGELEIDAIEDVFALSVASYTSQPAPDAGEEDPGLDDVQDTAGATVISTTTTAPPALPADGDTYLVPAGATGAWAGHEGETATWDEEADAWVFATVNDGTVITDGTTGTQVQVTGGVAGATAWTPAIPPLTVATPDPAADHIVFFDTSANAYRKALASLGGGGGGGGGGVGAGGVTGCMLSFSGTLNLTTAATDYYPNYTVTKDDGGYFNAGTPDRVTAPRDGWYVVSGMANGNAGSDTFSARIWKNGVATDLFSRHSVDSGVNAYVNVSGILYLEAGDYLRMAINSRNGGDQCNLAALQIASLLGSYSSPLQETILATAPDGYWRCDETLGTSLNDYSGNGNNLALSGTYTLALAALVPSEPSARFISFGVGGVATAAGDIMGLGNIYAGDYSFAAVIIPRNTGGPAVLCSHANTSGDAASQNYSFRPGVQANAAISDFFENGAGTDNVPSVTVHASHGHPQIVFVVRDSVAKTFTVYRNGVRVNSATYANNPTDGSASHRFRLGNDVDGNNWNSPMGHAAFWKRTLSATEIVAISQAAGFFNVGGGGGGGLVVGSGGGYPSVLGYAGI